MKLDQTGAKVPQIAKSLFSSRVLISNQLKLEKLWGL